MNQVKMLETAVKEVELRATYIKTNEIPEAIDCEYQRAYGYICAMHQMEIFDGEQFDAASDVLCAAKYEAKKATLLQQQESGKQKDRPNVDAIHTPSVDEKMPDVKAAMVNISICLANLIYNMKQAGIEEFFIFSAANAVKIGSGIAEGGCR